MTFPKKYQLQNHTQRSKTKATKLAECTNRACGSRDDETLNSKCPRCGFPAKRG